MRCRGSASVSSPLGPVLHDPGVPFEVGVVDVEAARSLVIGRKGDREQALLGALASDLSLEIGEEHILVAVRSDPR